MLLGFQDGDERRRLPECGQLQVFPAPPEALRLLTGALSIEASSSLNTSNIPNILMIGPRIGNLKKIVEESNRNIPAWFLITPVRFLQTQEFHAQVH